MPPHPGYLVDENGCWIWQGYVHRTTGYAGVMMHDGKPVSAHVGYYLRHRGAIPPRFDLDHTCRVRRCVNPDHLEPVPRKVNVRRSSAAKLTADQVAQIRTEVGAGAKRGTINALARSLGVSHSLVSLIAAGRRWR